MLRNVKLRVESWGDTLPPRPHCNAWWMWWQMLRLVILNPLESGGIIGCFWLLKNTLNVTNHSNLKTCYRYAVSLYRRCITLNFPFCPALNDAFSLWFFDWLMWCVPPPIGEGLSCCFLYAGTVCLQHSRHTPIIFHYSSVFLLLSGRKYAGKGMA